MRYALGLVVAAGLALGQSGANLYQQNCAFCHGENGQGRVGAFPPLAGHVADMVRITQGRQILIQSVLFGLQGPITVKGQRYNGVMPGFAQLRDEEIAGLLNYVLTAWGNDRLLPQGHRPITVAEVTTERLRRLTPAQVADVRRQLQIP